MARTKSRRFVLPVLALLALGWFAAAAADGGAQRTRRGGGGGSGSSSSTATRSGGASAPRIATGRATYGHHRGIRFGRFHPRHRFSYYPYGYRHYGYYGWYPGSYSIWWWPYPYYYGYGYDYRYGYGVYRERVPMRVAEGATVEIDVRPKRATVLLDGEEVGQARDYNGTWDVLWVEPGTHELELRAPERKTLRIQLQVRRGGHYWIRERLEKGDGIDPRSTTEPPRPKRTDRAAPPAAEPAPDLDVRPAEPREGSLRKGLLRIDARPGDAAVYLDGRFLARADELSRLHGALPVARGTHTVEVVRPGYASRSVEVDVAGSEPVDVRLVLERER